MTMPGIRGYTFISNQAKYKDVKLPQNARLLHVYTCWDLFPINEKLTFETAAIRTLIVKKNEFIT